MSQRYSGVAAAAFLAPLLVGFALFIFGPIAAGLGLSLFRWNLLSSPVYIGLDNYSTLLGDTRLVSVYLVTAFLAVFIIVANLTLGLLLALFLDARMPGFLRSIFRMTYFFPFVISGAAVALIWRFLFNKDFGVVNYFLGIVEVGPIDWLGASFWAPVSVGIAAVWKFIGFNVLVFVAGLQNIPRELYEAGIVDGAGRWALFRRITLPLLSPTALFLVVINTIYAFQLFAEPLVLTQGGPGDASRTVVQYIFETGMRSFNIGYAATISMSLLVILAVLIAAQFIVLRRWTFYR